MKLKFGKPEHGWMVITLDDHELDVSDVPCNSLLILTTALSQILSGSRSEEVDWSLEPNFASWIFAREGTELAFYLRPTEEGEPVLIERSVPHKIIDQILGALDKLAADEVWTQGEERLVWAADKQHLVWAQNEERMTWAPDGKHLIWSWPFPSAELEHLKAIRSERDGI